MYVQVILDDINQDVRNPHLVEVDLTKNRFFRLADVVAVRPDWRSVDNRR
jgi:hypothetical protein